MAEILEAIVARIPAPKGNPEAPLQGLIFDSHYDPYKGVIAYVRLAQGPSTSTTVRLMASGAEPNSSRSVSSGRSSCPSQLEAGEVGYVATGLKSVREAQVGDTLRADPRRPTRCPATRRPRAWCSRASTRSAATTTRSCGTPSRSSTSTTPPSPTSLRARWPSASASGAASSASSTWRSSRSA